MKSLILGVVIISLLIPFSFDAPTFSRDIEVTRCSDGARCEYCNAYNECLSCENYFMKIGDSELKKCLEQCYPNQYSVFVVNKQECLYCHPACVYGCTGPNSTVSEDGCNKCQYGVLKGQDKKCLVKAIDNLSPCEKGYFLKKAGKEESVWTDYICLECDPACSSCTSSGPHPVKDKCMCKNYLAIDYQSKQQKFCTEECPDHFTEVLKKSEMSLCLRCAEDEVINSHLEACVKKEKFGSYIFISLLILLIIFAIIIFLVCMVYKRRRPSSGSASEKLIDNNDSDTPLITRKITNDNFFILGHQLKFDLENDKQIELGRGYFGPVYKGKMTKENQTMDVAIKVIEKENAIQQAVQEGATLRANLQDHPYVNKTIGVSIETPNPLMVIFPLRKYNLQAHFDDLKNKNAKLDTWVLFLYCKQIASAMVFLGQHGIVHCNLKATSILVKENQHIVVSSFGYTHYSKQNLLNINVTGYRWRALECLVKDEVKFTHKSDIWAYGIVCWEIFNNCEKKPYADNIQNESELKEFLEKGHRLHMPRYCKHGTFFVIQECWEGDPNRRPTFERLFNFFEGKTQRLEQASKEVINKELPRVDASTTTDGLMDDDDSFLYNVPSDPEEDNLPTSSKETSHRFLLNREVAKISKLSKTESQSSPECEDNAQNRQIAANRLKRRRTVSETNQILGKW